jgi:hypothetical protein
VTGLRVQYKLCLPMHHIYSGRAPAYLMDRVQATSARTRHEGLRSAATTSYVIPGLRTKFGERSSHKPARPPGTLCPRICANKPSYRLSKSNSKHSFSSLPSIFFSSFYDCCNAPMFFLLCAQYQIFLLRLRLRLPQVLSRVAYE